MGDDVPPPAPFAPNPLDAVPPPPRPRPRPSDPRCVRVPQTPAASLPPPLSSFSQQTTSLLPPPFAPNPLDAVPSTPRPSDLRRVPPSSSVVVLPDDLPPPTDKLLPRQPPSSARGPSPQALLLPTLSLLRHVHPSSSAAAVTLPLCHPSSSDALLPTPSLLHRVPPGSSKSMTSTRDRTDDFKDAVHSMAQSFGYAESKMAAILASFIMHKPLHSSRFMKAALKTLESIDALNQFIVKHRKDYVDLHRSTEQERDNIEHEVSAFIKACKDQIDILKNKINENETNEDSRAWLGKLGDTSNVDLVAHKHGVVLILSERLCTVAAQFDRLRSIRFQDAVNRTMPRRKLHKVTESKSSDASNSNLSEFKGQESLPAPVSRVQEQLLDDETQALQVELSNMLDAVQETEAKMVEMSALNHLMSTHVLQQAQQIEYLYEQAVEATMNVQKGNQELSQAIERNSSSRTFLLLFLFVLTFSILFLDWYN